MSRNNLVNSACLEFFEFIRKENVKPVISHIVETYPEKLKQITYVDTFGNYIIRYEQTQGFASVSDTSYLDTDEDTPKRPDIGRGSRWDNGVKDLDSTEEEYFNTSDDEEEISVKSPSSRASHNEGAVLSKPLVDYDSDEDNENTVIDVAVPVLLSKNAASELSKSGSAGVTTPKSSVSPTPPEKLSEKRRREEDEEDELGKLAHHKRRNSSSSSGSDKSNLLRRKKSFRDALNGTPGSGKPNKIAITLSTAVKTGGESIRGDGGN